MDCSLKIIFNRRKTASETKKGAVEIEIYQKRPPIRKRISTGVGVFMHQWKNGMVVNHPNSVTLNLAIQDKYRELSQVITRLQGNLQNFSIDAVNQNSFTDWLESQIESRKDLADQTLRQHRTLIKEIKEFGRFVHFEDLTVENLTLWDNQLRSHLNKQSAIYDYHKRLKVYVNRAMRLGLISNSPYALFKAQRGKSGTVKYLTDIERSKIEALELTGGIAVARDMFLLACYTGLAYCDLVRLKKDVIISEGGHDFICDQRMKTASAYRLLILPQAKTILERYNYDMNRMSNQKCNVYLKAIAVLAEIKSNLTFHMGRHTFATWALKNGVGIEVVSKMLAHADIATTQIYAKVLQSEVTAGFEKLKKSATPEC